MICILIFLIVSIVGRFDSNFRGFIAKNVYNDNIAFSYFKCFYNKYLGGVFPINDISNKRDSSVFKEQIDYIDATKYEDGVLLRVNDNYLIPNINEGIVVYIGNKDKYGNVIIVEGNDGIDIWYGNICNSSLKIYDNVLNGDYIGEVCGNYFYLVYSKENSFLDYRDYL